MAKKRILIDLDGICADMAAPLLDRYNNEHDDTVRHADITTWGIHEHVKIGHRIYDYAREPGFYENLPVFDGALEGVEQLAQMGHAIRFCSAGMGPDSLAEKLRWCAHHFGHLHIEGKKFNRRHLILTHDKHWINADILIDDKPETIAKWAKSGREAMFIDWPYNKHLGSCGFAAQDWTNTKKAWGQIVDYIAEIS